MTPSEALEWKVRAISAEDRLADALSQIAPLEESNARWCQRVKHLETVIDQIRRLIP